MLFTPMGNGSKLILSQNTYREIVPILPDAGSKPLTRDIELRPAPDVRARFLDPDGKPLAGVWVYGVESERWGLTSNVVKTAEFTIQGMHPKRPRTVYFQHDGKALVGIQTITAGDRQPLRLQLQPWAVATGQVVGLDGKPLAGATVHPRIVETRGGVNYSLPTYQPANCHTDADGKFCVTGLLPGRKYSLSITEAGKSTSSHEVSVREAPRPGEVRDLGVSRVRGRE
jgi:hypothetical protein